MRKCLLVILFLFWASTCWATPSITSGTTSSITGTGFGTNTSVGTSKLQYNGSNIESGTDGGVFTMTGWGVYSTTESDENAVPRYSSTKAHSGSQSIKIDYTHDDSLNRYKGNFYYDYGSGISRVYVSFWVICDRAGSTGQWKIWRIKNDTSFTDGSLDFIQNCFANNTSRIASLFTTQGNDDWDCNGCAYDSHEQYLSADEVPGPTAVMNRWVRMEYWIDVGTRDNYDGTFFYKFHDPDNSTPVIKDIPKLSFDGNLMILKTGTTSDWQALLFGGAAVDGLDLLVYFDDVFIQIGSWARVEIGDASTWANCTHREVQLPTSWSDTSISFTLQQGSFSSGQTVYLFVVDDDGNASSGYAITLPGGSIGGSSQLKNIGSGASQIKFK